jgi:hypothetical protein
MPTQYYMLIEGRRIGPLAKSDLAAGGLERDTLVWFLGADDWLPAREVPDLRDLVATLPPPAPRPTLWERLPAPLHQPFRRPARSNPATFRVLYGWFLATLLIGVAFAGLAIVFGILYEEHRVVRQGFRGRNPLWEIMAVLSGILAAPPLAASSVLFFVQLYKMWNLVQDGRADVTPEAAVGLCFVPLFNLFWIFVALCGLAKNLNAFCDRQHLRARRVPVGLVLAACVVLVIPCVNFFSLILMPVCLAVLKNTASDIAAQVSGHEEDDSLAPREQWE